jgi:hypothetical protein
MIRACEKQGYLGARTLDDGCCCCVIALVRACGCRSSLVAATVGKLCKREWKLVRGCRRHWLRSHFTCTVACAPAFVIVGGAAAAAADVVSTWRRRSGAFHHELLEVSDLCGRLWSLGAKSSRARLSTCRRAKHLGLESSTAPRQQGGVFGRATPPLASVRKVLVPSYAPDRPPRERVVFFVGCVIRENEENKV